MRWFIFLPLAILVVLFMLSNPQSIELRLWPFDVAWTASASIAVLSIAAVAFLLGALIAYGVARYFTQQAFDRALLDDARRQGLRLLYLFTPPLEAAPPCTFKLAELNI